MHAGNILPAGALAVNADGAPADHDMDLRAWNSPSPTIPVSPTQYI